MRHIPHFLLSLTLVLVAGAALAQPSPPYNCTAAPVYAPVGPVPWWDYTKNPLTVEGDATCWTLSTGWTPGETSCSYTSSDGWTFTGGRAKTMTHQFVVGANDSGSSSWSAGFDLEFVDPYDDWYSQISLTVSVTHNGVTTTTTLYSHTGNNGDVCGAQYGSFTAVNGDTVKFTFKATNLLGAEITVNDFYVHRWAS
jgi:hypothetical protein